MGWWRWCCMWAVAFLAQGSVQDKTLTHCRFLLSLFRRLYEFVRSEFQRLKLNVAALSLYLAAAPRPVAGSFLRSQKNQPSSKTAAPSSSELPSAGECSQLQPGLASRALAIAVAHGLIVFIDLPLKVRAHGRWLLVWPQRVQVAPLCQEVAIAHRARTLTDLAILWLCGNAGSSSSESSSGSD